MDDGLRYLVSVDVTVRGSGALGVRAFVVQVEEREPYKAVAVAFQLCAGKVAGLFGFLC